MSAEILYFPVSREAGRARRVAQIISKRTTKKSMQAYWDQITAGIANRLRNAQATEDEIDRQIAEFHSAVSAELNRLARNRG